MAWVAWFWVGLTGVGLVCVAATTVLRSLWQSGQRVADVGEPVAVWIMPWAVCIKADQQQHWLCRDEVPAGQWAALLRHVRTHVPHQAVGLSLSN